jgi:WD40 repeat protein
MRRLARWLIGTVNGRRVLLALLLAAAWTGWGLVPPRPLAAWTALSPPIGRTLLSPRGDRLVTIETVDIHAGGGDEALRLWDLSSGRELLSVERWSGGLWDIGFTLDGSWLVAQSGSLGVCVWDAADGRLHFRLPPPDEEVPPRSIYSFAVSPDGRVLASTIPHQQPPTVQLWDTESGRCYVTLDGACEPLVFAPDGRTLATGREVEPDGRTGVRLWDVAGGREAARLRGGPARPIRSVAFRPDGRQLAAGLRAWRDDDKTPVPVMVWDLPSGRPVALFPGIGPDGSGDGPDAGLAFSPDGRLLEIRLDHCFYWDLSTNPPVNRSGRLSNSEDYRWPDGSVRYPLFNPSGTRLIVSGPRLGTWVVHDTSTLAPVAECRMTGIVQQQPVLSPDGRLMAVPARPGPLDYSGWVTKLERRLGRPLPWLYPGPYTHVFDLTTGADLGRTPWSESLIGFGPDGRTVWGYSQSGDPLSGRIVLAVEQWGVPSRWPPVWLIAVTAFAVLLAAVDLWRSRRSARVGAGGGK